MKLSKKITTTLSAVIMVACCVAFLLLGISETGWKALAIPSDSMRPDMPPGTLVLVHSVPASELKIGDVITYANPLRPQTTLSHRIVKKYMLDGKVPAFVTKGDANKTDDIPITIGSVKGKVVWHMRNIGYILLYAKDPLVILPFVYMAGLLITMEEVKRLSDYYKRLQPYRIPGFHTISNLESHGNIFKKKLFPGISLTVLFILISAATGPTALALLRSNTVTLATNRLVVATKIPVKNKCPANSDTTVNVNNSSTQSSSTGNATVSGNTNGGSATSGSATNTNTTTTTTTVINC